MKTQFRGWTIPGPRPPGGVDKGDGESLDALCGHWWIFQQKKGHRFSTDDVLCAWYATECAPRVERYCDLGAGLGSVAMMVAWRRPGCEMVTVEAQAESLRLQRKSLRYNGIEDRVTVREGDLRDDTLFADLAPFDLVTGSPPYWAEDAALPAASAQAIGARLETRGDVRDYCARASALLAPGGAFVLVHQAAHDARVRAAIDDAGLVLVRTRAVCFKRGVAAEESGARVYACARREDLPPTTTVEEAPLTIRELDGSVSAEYSAIKLSVGFPP